MGDNPRFFAKFGKEIWKRSKISLNDPFGGWFGPAVKYQVIFRAISQNKIDNNAWVRGDMEFLFECSKRYLTSERSERVRYRIEHEKRNSISPSNHVLLCLLYKHKSPKQNWENFYSKATAVSVKAEGKSNSSSTD